MLDPVAHRAFVQAGQARDVAPGVFGGDAASGLADDDGDLAFVIQLLGFRWAQQGFAMAHERTRKAREHAGVGGRRAAVLVFLVALAVVHAHADDFFWRRNRRQQPHFVQLVRGGK
ncbi:hypothetical protein D3C72_2082670 [compost metagenome]